MKIPKKAEKLLFILLIMALSLSCLSSCNGGDSESTAYNDEYQYEELSLSLPEYLSFGGTEFTVLYSSRMTSPPSAFDDEGKAYPLDRAVAERKKEVEGTLAVRLKTEERHSLFGNAELVKSKAAGDGCYDAVYMSPQDMASLAYLGYLAPFSALEHISLNGRLWREASLNEFCYGGNIYFADSSVSYINNGAVIVISCDKEILGEEAASKIEADVIDGKFTLDRLLNYTKDGYVIDNDHSPYCLFAACGYKITENDGYSLTLTNIDGRLKDIDGKIKELSKSFAPTEPTNVPDLSKAEEEKYPFTVSEYRLVSEKESEGKLIIPLPKYEENEEYISPVRTYSCLYIGVPAGAESYEMSGAVLEALAFFGEKLITPAYFRQKDNSELLPLIFGNIAYDSGDIFKIGGLSDSLSFSEPIEDTYRNAADLEKELSDINRAIERLRGVE